MNFNNLSAWCIRNPVVPIVLFIGLMLAGMVTFSQMKVQNDPDIEFPIIIIAIAQPGAAPSEIENQITQKVEASLRSIQGVQNIASNAREGVSETSLEFSLGTDVIEALNDTKNAIDQVRGSLPDGILEPQVFKLQLSSEPIGTFSATTTDMTLEQLSWYVDDTVSKSLLAVPGMAEVSRAGGVSREITVILDPAKMQSLGISASQINAILRQLNTNAAGGRSEIGGTRQTVRVLGNANTAYELSQTDIPLGGGRTVKLADVAKVSDLFGEISSIGKVAGKQVVTFEISRARGESDVSVYDGALARLAELEARNPTVKFTKLFTSVGYTKAQYESSIAAMVEGAVLAVIVVFFFLRDWRATFISALAIPLSAIPAFWFIDMIGITLNSMSLLALGLVAGVLVDDAIVEIENIVRHMRMGKSAYQASIDAADEIGLAVVATTFSIVAVFLPVSVMPGISGQFFKNFGWTVVVSVLTSLAVARMITPMIAAYFLKAKGQAEHGGGIWMDRYMDLLHWSLDNSKAKAARALLERVRGGFLGFLTTTIFFLIIAAAALGALVGAIKGMQLLGLTAMVMFVPAILALALGGWLAARLIGLLAGLIGGRIGGYYTFQSARFAARLQDHRVWMMGVGLGSLGLTGVLFASIPMQLFPDADIEFARVNVELVPGTTLLDTEKVVSQVAAIIEQRPEVETIQQRIRESSGSLFITYSADRANSSQVIERELNPLLQKVPDARVAFQTFNQVGPGGIGRPISKMLTGADSALLEATAAKLVEQMQTVPGVVAPRISADTRRPELIITPRQDLAASLGVTTQSLSQAVRIATLGDIDQNAAKFSLSDRQIPIRVRLSEDARRNLAVIQNLPVQTANGGSVPLSSVAEFSIGSGPVAIRRFNQERRVFVGADLGPDADKGTVDAEIDKLPILNNLPPGIGDTPFGEAEVLEELLTNFFIALASAALLVLAVLILLYHRFVSPLVNMGSLFLAPLGGLIAIYIAGQSITLPVFIGILMLFGIVAKNSILLIDFAIEEMAAGVPKFEAIMDAGHKRAQPIVMTTVAMVAGMVPTAISIGADSAWRAPMGTVVIGGLILSTLLTLVIVPAGFSLTDGFEKRIGPALRRRLLSYEPGDDTADRQLQAGALPAE
jgi:multidrug efflux pump subunit AcrB